jgi:hypothetical protein
MRLERFLKYISRSLCIFIEVGVRSFLWHIRSCLVRWPPFFLAHSFSFSFRGERERRIITQLSLCFFFFYFLLFCLVFPAIIIIIDRHLLFFFSITKVTFASQDFLILILLV